MGSAESRPAVFDDPARGLTIALLSVTTVAAILRTLALHLNGTSIKIDDCIVYVAYILNTSLLITNLVEISHGAVSLPRLATMSKDEQTYLMNLTLAFGVLYILTIVIIKISLLFLYRRIFTMQVTWFRVGWWINFLLLMPGYLVFAFTCVGIQVRDRNNLGDKENALSRVGSVVGGAINSFSDFLVVALPAGMVSQMWLPTREKLGIIGIFSLGLLATAISLMRAVRFQLGRQWNPAYAFYNDTVLSTTESSVALLCVCLMLIKPLLRAIRDFVVSGAGALTTALSSGSASRFRSTKASSVHSDTDNLRLKSPTQNGGITRVQHYDVESTNLRSFSGQRDIVLETIHAK